MALFDFIETNLPGYYSNDQIALIDDIRRYFTGELTDEEAEEKGLLEYGQDQLFEEYERLLSNAFERAYNARHGADSV